jgi:hypothetical protein
VSYRSCLSVRPLINSFGKTTDSRENSYEHYATVYAPLHFLILHQHVTAYFNDCVVFFCGFLDLIV